MIAQVDKEASEIWRSIALLPTDDIYMAEDAGDWSFCFNLIDRKNVFGRRFRVLVHPRLQKMFGKRYSARKYLTERLNENKS